MHSALASIRSRFSVRLLLEASHYYLIAIIAICLYDVDAKLNETHVCTSVFFCTLMSACLSGGGEESETVVRSMLVCLRVCI